MSRFRIEDPTFAAAPDLGDALAAHFELIRSHSDWREAPRSPLGAGEILDPPGAIYPYVRCRVTLPVPAERLARFIVHDVTRTMTTWNKVTISAREIESLGAAEKVLQIRSKVPVLAIREDVFFQAIRVHGEATVELSTGVDHPGAPRGQPGTVRSRLHFCAKRIEPAGPAGSHYEVLWQYDPAGWLGRLVPRRMMAASLLRNMLHECEQLHAIFSAPAA